MSPDDLESAVNEIFDNLELDEEGEKLVTAISITDLKKIQEMLPEDRQQAFEDRYKDKKQGSIGPCFCYFTKD